MAEETRNTFKKAERICSKTAIETLFSGKGKSLSAYPLRAVYLSVEREFSDAAVSILISVPKKKFKRAVKRNRIKRQIREAYRKSKHELYQQMKAEEGQQLLVAFLFMDNKFYPTDVIEKKTNSLLARIKEDLEKKA